ncbi:LysR family transcriptional regulator [uncultured Devosia sp.]|uniref:LysR family transcriptional regulator n=1 Tax=uncultured Devosia sp. TaxID=211434 RepID=UPI0035CBEAF8
MANNDERMHLDDLSVFLAVLESGGFRTAAKRLGLSASSVSEKITQLELRLGVPLLIRTTRSLSATEAGRSLANRIAPLFIETRAALQDAASAQQTVRGLLKLNVTGAVMVDILPPIIDRFLARHPEVRVEIMVEDRLVDVTAAGCDAGIRYGEHLAQDMIAIPIGPRTQRLAYAAAPSYLQERGIPQHPRDVLKHDCVRMRFSSGALVEWSFERAGETLTLDPPGRLIIGVDAAPAAINFARDGRGIVGTFENWLMPYLSDGTLQPVLADWWTRFEGPWIYFSKRFMPAPLRAFLDMLTD